MILFTLLFMLQICSGVFSKINIDTRPNIIFYLADDMGPGDITIQNSSFSYNKKHVIKTPNIEQFSSESTCFHQVWAASVCSPSRYSILTGIPPTMSKIKGNQYNRNIEFDYAFPQELQKLGYETALIGKYGFGDIKSANDIGFDYFFGYETHEDAHLPFPTQMSRNKEIIYYPENIDANSKKCVNTNVCTYSMDLFLNESVDFIEKKHKKPFFLYFASIANHVGIWNINDKFMSNPTNTYGIYENVSWNVNRKGHAYMTSIIDRDIGTITNTLKKLKIEENTIFIFSSDNGAVAELVPNSWKKNYPKFFDSAGGRRGTKTTLYEGGLMSPVIVRWPKYVQPNQHNYYPWSLHDIPLTLLNAIDAPKNSTDKFTFVEISSSISVLDLWKTGNLSSDRKWLSNEVCIDRCAYTLLDISNWKENMPKLIYNRKFFLYDIKKDPMEKRNLARRKKNRKIIKNMIKIINKIRK